MILRSLKKKKKKKLNWYIRKWLRIKIQKKNNIFFVVVFVVATFPTLFLLSHSFNSTQSDRVELSTARMLWSSKKKTEEKRSEKIHISKSTEVKIEATFFFFSRSTSSSPAKAVETASCKIRGGIKANVKPDFEYSWCWVFLWVRLKRLVKREIFPKKKFKKKIKEGTKKI